MWGAAGKDTATLDKFFADLPDGAAAGIEAVSMDMGPAYAKSVRKPEPAPHAVICFDPFHVVKLATDALETLRRKVWQAARTLPDKRIAQAFKGARWALLKNPGAPRSTLLYPWFSQEKLEDVSLGPMTYPDAERRWGPQHVRKRSPSTSST